MWATSTLTKAPELKDRSICHYFHVNGCCRNWRTCPHPHGIFCEVSCNDVASGSNNSNSWHAMLTVLLLQTCGKWCLHPYNESERIVHTQQCSERAAREAVRAVSAEQECSICLEKVLEKPIAERRFGLLACNHPFCLGCIKNWRTEGGADVDTVSVVSIEPYDAILLSTVFLCATEESFTKPMHCRPSEHALSAVNPHIMLHPARCGHALLRRRLQSSPSIRRGCRQSTASTGYGATRAAPLAPHASIATKAKR